MITHVAWSRIMLNWLNNRAYNKILIYKRLLKRNISTPIYIYVSVNIITLI